MALQTLANYSTAENNQLRVDITYNDVAVGTLPNGDPELPITSLRYYNLTGHNATVKITNNTTGQVDTYTLTSTNQNGRPVTLPTNAYFFGRNVDGQIYPVGDYSFTAA